MPKTLKLKQNVYLSPKFGGIEHGEKPDPNLKKGATVEFQSEALSKLLIERGLAEEVKVGGEQRDVAAK